MSEHNLPPTFLVYHEEQDHAVGQRTAQQPQESSHHTRPERERQEERQRDVQQEMTQMRQDNGRPAPFVSLGR